MIFEEKIDEEIESKLGEDESCEAEEKPGKVICEFDNEDDFSDDGDDADEEEDIDDDDDEEDDDDIDEELGGDDADEEE